MFGTLWPCRGPRYSVSYRYTGCGNEAVPFLPSLSSGLSPRAEPLLFTSFRKIPWPLRELKSDKKATKVEALIVQFGTFGNKMNV